MSEAIIDSQSLTIPAISTLTESSEPYSIEKVKDTVEKYYPALVPAVMAELAVFGAMALANRTKPLSLIFEGSSGAGKTAVVQMVFPVHKQLNLYMYRTDKFTPQAFVSHAANKQEFELRDQDLLPKLKKKVLVTKELAPIFRGRTEDLTNNFAMLISVLDGSGFTSDSGMRGQRGYQETIVFNWIGATTPIPRETHKLMSQLGTRLLFYEAPDIEPNLEQLLEYAKQDNSSKAETACAKAVNDFLLEFFQRNGVGTKKPEKIIISDGFLREMVNWGQLLVKGRAEVRYEKEEQSGYEPIAALKSEAPWRVIGYFKDLARGHALIHGRAEVNESDLELIAHVAISSIPGHLRPVVKALRKETVVNSTHCAALCRVSKPTARNYLKELSLLGIADLTKGSRERNLADEISLSESFRWLNPDLENEV
jgi:hypothetical protein